MARENKINRFASAGKALVGAARENEKSEDLASVEKKEINTVSVMKKDKVVTAKVYPETWAEFTAINRARGMTNNSVINMLITEYIRNNKVILE